ncbi:MAG: acetate kinase, partial [Myxococcota bacterium]
REIGALSAVLQGLDGLVFTAGIGENSSAIRERVCEGLGWLGVSLRRDANDDGRQVISDSQSQVSVLALPTDEELVIARSAQALR